MQLHMFIAFLLKHLHKSTHACSYYSLPISVSVSPVGPIHAWYYIAPVAETGFSHRLTAYKMVGHFFGLLNDQEIIRSKIVF